MIFVGIASYRDSELLPTIRDCIAKAKYPDDLRFGICLQDEKPDIGEFQDDKRFLVYFLPWEKAQGLGFARSKVQELYNGEDHYLQLDSHHRFTQDWDETLLKMVELTGSKKPILGTYAGIYEPQNLAMKMDKTPCKMVADEFTPSGTIKFKPQYIQNWNDLSYPIPARFCSGHFTFTIGKFLEEYKFDPEIFFAGEEISMAIRGYTLGYDLFHPHRQVIYHEFLRKHRPKVWDDDSLWHKRDAISKKRIRQLLKEENNGTDLGPYGLGTDRTHRDYELYAGINFAKRLLHPDCTHGFDPPTGADGSEIDPDLDSTYYALEDGSGNVLHKLYRLPGSSPLKVVKWERTKSKGWGKRTDTKL